MKKYRVKALTGECECAALRACCLPEGTEIGEDDVYKKLSNGKLFVFVTNCEGERCSCMVELEEVKV